MHCTTHAEYGERGLPPCCLECSRPYHGHRSTDHSKSFPNTDKSTLITVRLPCIRAPDRVTLLSNHRSSRLNGSYYSVTYAYTDRSVISAANNCADCYRPGDSHGFSEAVIDHSRRIIPRSASPKFRRSKNHHACKFKCM